MSLESPGQSSKHTEMVAFAEQNDDVTVEQLLREFTLSIDEIDDAVDVLREVDPEALANDETVPAWALPTDLGGLVADGGDQQDEGQTSDGAPDESDQDDGQRALDDLPADMVAYAEKNPDVTAPALLGRFLRPPEDRDVAEAVLRAAGSESDPSTSSDETADVDEISEGAPDGGPAPDESAPDADGTEGEQAGAGGDDDHSEGDTASGDDDDVSAWVEDVPGFLTPGDDRYLPPETDVWPGGWDECGTWMCRKGKLPFAPWGEKSPAISCDKSTCPKHGDETPDAVTEACEACAAHRDGTTMDECGHDARFKWGRGELYRDIETVAMAEIDPHVDGRAFIQQKDDPYFFIDGDDVRCPETGEWHPVFLDIIGRTGPTYADESVSGSGGHLPYTGDIPEGFVQAKFEIDGEPWGANDDLPEVEIYATRRVCVTTGKHVAGTPTDVREVDADGLRNVLDEYGHLPESRRDLPGEYEEFDPDEHEPSATASGEVTSDIDDVYAALSRLDPRDVAGKTIVHQWNDSASTSAGTRAFAPTWGPGCNGTANIVDDKIWQDTGGGGYGGPVVMALLDIGAPGISPSTVTSKSPTGRTWYRGVDRLRELGYEIPHHIPGRGTTRSGGGTYDKTPGWALRKAALALGVIDSEEDLVERENDDGETYQALPSEAYNRTVRRLEEEGVDTSRQTPATKRADPTRAELGLDREAKDEFDEVAKQLAASMIKDD